MGELSKCDIQEFENCKKLKIVIENIRKIETEISKELAVEEYKTLWNEYVKLLEEMKELLNGKEG